MASSSVSTRTVTATVAVVPSTPQTRPVAQAAAVLPVPELVVAAGMQQPASVVAQLPRIAPSAAVAVGQSQPAAVVARIPLMAAAAAASNGLPLVWDSNVSLTLPGEVFSGPVGATYIDSNGALQKTAVANTPRPHYDANGIRYRVLEGGSGNLIPHSEDDPTWAARGTTPPTVQTSVTVDGVLCTQTDFLATSNGTFNTSRAVNTGAASIAAGVYSWIAAIKISRPLVAGEDVQVYVTGVSGMPAVHLTSANSAALQSWTTIGATNGTQIAGTQFFAIYAINLASPLTVWCSRRQYELGPQSTSYIPTVATAVSRSAEGLYLAQAEAPQPVTFYGKLIVTGLPAAGGATHGLFHRGGLTNIAPKFQAYINPGDNKVTVTYADGALSGTCSDASNTFVAGDVLEFIAQVLPSGKAFVSTAKNGGVFSAGTASAVTPAFPGAYRGSMLCLGGLGSTVSSFNYWRAAKYAYGNITGDNMRAFV